MVREILAKVREAEQKAEAIIRQAREQGLARIREAQQEAERVRAEAQAAVKESIDNAVLRAQAEAREEIDKRAAENREAIARMRSSAEERLPQAVQAVLKRFV